MKYFDPIYWFKAFAKFVVGTSGLFGNQDNPDNKTITYTRYDSLTRNSIVEGPCAFPKLTGFEICKNNPWRVEVDDSCLDVIHTPLFSRYIEVTNDRRTLYIRYSDTFGKIYRWVERYQKTLDPESAKFIVVNRADKSVKVRQGCPIKVVIRLLKTGIFNNRIIKVSLNDLKGLKHDKEGYFMAGARGGKDDIVEALQNTSIMKSDRIASYFARPELNFIKENGTGFMLLFIRRGEVDYVLPANIPDFNEHKMSFPFIRMDRPNCYKATPFDSLKDSEAYSREYQPDKQMTLSNSNSTKLKAGWTVIV